MGLLQMACLVLLLGLGPAQAAEPAVSAGGQGDPAGPREVVGPQLWRVGPTRKLRWPSEAARVAKDGDTIEIDAGVYRNDYAVWRQDYLIIRGVGGLAHLQSRGWIPNGKAIWITRGDGLLIENIEFSGASVRDTNGAGIRHEGGRLALRNTFFHDNEFSVLAGRLPAAQVDIHDSRFWDQKRPIRHSHGIYIGRVGRFIFIGNHVTGTDQGHQVKSRAFENLIAYNRIEDRPGGSSSRMIDLSNCGYSIVLGNQLQQAASSQNLNAIGYGPEGCGDRDSRHRRLYVVNNTFVNEARAGEFVRNFSDGPAYVLNNLLFGVGSILRGAGERSHNQRLPLRLLSDTGWSVRRGSAELERALEAKGPQAIGLLPRRVFQPPAGTGPRMPRGEIEVGAGEWRQAPGS